MCLQQNSAFDLEKIKDCSKDQHYHYTHRKQNNYWQDICIAVILLIKIIFVHIRDSYYKYFCHFYGTLDLQKLNMKGIITTILWYYAFSSNIWRSSISYLFKVLFKSSMSSDEPNCPSPAQADQCPIRNCIPVSQCSMCFAAL